MEKMFQVIEDLKKEGVIQNYALGGAQALLFYDEPRATYDVDVFIFSNHINPTGLVDLSIAALKTALEKKGYAMKNDYFMIGEFPLQFLPPKDALMREAIEQAVVQNYGHVQVRVFSLEHLMAIMVDTNRPKDWARLSELRALSKHDDEKFHKILKKYDLEKKWEAILEKIQ